VTDGASDGLAQRTDLSDAEAVIALFDQAATVIRTATYRDRSVVRLPARGRLIATGDLHDNPFHLQKIIRYAALDTSPDHHVVLHELIHGDKLLNGMDFSYRTFARVAELVVAYPGQVHPMLANHELAQMNQTSVTKGGGDSVQMFDDALAYVFGDDSVSAAEAINRFIRAMPLAVVSESGLLCAHSIPTDSTIERFDEGVLERELEDADYVGPSGAAYLMTWGRRYSTEVVERLARRWNVELFCLGHERVDTGIEVRGKRVVVLNSDHERATVLPLDLAALPPAAEAVMYSMPLASLP